MDESVTDDGRRHSILKPRNRFPLQEVQSYFPDDDTVTTTFTRSRRVSFGKNLVKEFLVGSSVSTQAVHEYEQSSESLSDPSECSGPLDLALNKSYRDLTEPGQGIASISSAQCSLDPKPKNPEQRARLFTESCISLAKSVFQDTETELTAIIIGAMPTQGDEERKNTSRMNFTALDVSHLPEAGQQEFVPMHHSDLQLNLDSSHQIDKSRFDFLDQSNAHVSVKPVAKPIRQSMRTPLASISHIAPWDNENDENIPPAHVSFRAATPGVISTENTMTMEVTCANMRKTLQSSAIHYSEIYNGVGSQSDMEVTCGRPLQNYIEKSFNLTSDESDDTSIESPGLDPLQLDNSRDEFLSDLSGLEGNIDAVLHPSEPDNNQLGGVQKQLSEENQSFCEQLQCRSWNKVEITKCTQRDVTPSLTQKRESNVTLDAPIPLNRTDELPLNTPLTGLTALSTRPSFRDRLLTTPPDSITNSIYLDPSLGIEEALQSMEITKSVTVPNLNVPQLEDDAGINESVKTIPGTLEKDGPRDESNGNISMDMSITVPNMAVPQLEDDANINESVKTMTGTLEKDGPRDESIGNISMDMSVTVPNLAVPQLEDDAGINESMKTIPGILERDGPRDEQNGVGCQSDMEVTCGRPLQNYIEKSIYLTSEESDKTSIESPGLDPLQLDNSRDEFLSDLSGLEGNIDAVLNPSEPDNNQLGGGQKRLSEENQSFCEQLQDRSLNKLEITKCTQGGVTPSLTQTLSNEQHTIDESTRVIHLGDTYIKDTAENTYDIVSGNVKTLPCSLQNVEKRAHSGSPLPDERLKRSRPSHSPLPLNVSKPIRSRLGFLDDTFPVAPQLEDSKVFDDGNFESSVGKRSHSDSPLPTDRLLKKNRCSNSPLSVRSLDLREEAKSDLSDFCPTGGMTDLDCSVTLNDISVSVSLPVSMVREEASLLVAKIPLQDQSGIAHDLHSSWTCASDVLLKTLPAQDKMPLEMSVTVPNLAVPELEDDADTIGSAKTISGLLEKDVPRDEPNGNISMNMSVTLPNLAVPQLENEIFTPATVPNLAVPQLEDGADINESVKTIPKILEKDGPRDEQNVNISMNMSATVPNLTAPQLEDGADINESVKTMTGTLANDGPRDDSNGNISIDMSVTVPNLAVPQLEDVADINESVKTMTGTLANDGPRDEPNGNISLDMSVTVPNLAVPQLEDGANINESVKTMTGTLEKDGPRDEPNGNISMEMSVTVPNLAVPQLEDVADINESVKTMTGTLANDGPRDDSNGNISIDMSVTVPNLAVPQLEDVADINESVKTMTGTLANDGPRDEPNGNISLDMSVTVPNLAVPQLEDGANINESVKTMTGTLEKDGPRDEPNGNISMEMSVTVPNLAVPQLEDGADINESVKTIPGILEKDEQNVNISMNMSATVPNLTAPQLVDDTGVKGTYGVGGQSDETSVNISMDDSALMSVSMQDTINSGNNSLNNSSFGIGCTVPPPIALSPSAIASLSIQESTSVNSTRIFKKVQRALEEQSREESCIWKLIRFDYDAGEGVMEVDLPLLDTGLFLEICFKGVGDSVLANGLKVQHRPATRSQLSYKIKINEYGFHALKTYIQNEEKNIKTLEDIPYHLDFFNSFALKLTDLMKDAITVLRGCPETEFCGHVLSLNLHSIIFLYSCYVDIDLNELLLLGQPILRFRHEMERLDESTITDLLPLVEAPFLQSFVRLARGSIVKQETQTGRVTRRCKLLF